MKSAAPSVPAAAPGAKEEMLKLHKELQEQAAKQQMENDRLLAMRTTMEEEYKQRNDLQQKAVLP